MNYIGGIMKIKKDALLLAGALLCAGALIVFSYKAKEGALYGAALAEKVVIPSLLPLLIIFNFILNCGAGRVLETILSPFTYGVLRLPKCTGATVFFGLIGGYPTGALLTANLYRNSDIDSSTAKRLLRFNFSGGAGFIITAVGTGILRNRQQGLILFFSVIISALICACAGALIWKGAKAGDSDFMAMPAADALNKSVEQSTRSVINMAACIILFCALQGIVSIPHILSPLIEITSGTAEVGTEYPLPVLAFFLAFGGFCIHLQIFSIIREVGMKYADFLLWRVINGVLSCLVCMLLLKIFPNANAVFSNVSDSIIRPTSVNAALSVLMLLGSAVLIFDLENRKRKC